MSNQPLIPGGNIYPGPVRARTPEVDGEIFIPSFDFAFDVGTWTWTRIAAGDYAMVKTAGANTSHPAVNLTAYLNKKIGADPITQIMQNSPSLAAQLTGIESALDPSIGNFLNSGATARLRGYKIIAFDVVYKIATANLTTHSVALNRNTYANNAANTVAAVGGALGGALATATQANPYVTTVTPATPFIIGNNLTDVAEWLELLVTDPGTSVYTLYGVFVRYQYNIL